MKKIFLGLIQKIRLRRRKRLQKKIAELSAEKSFLTINLNWQGKHQEAEALARHLDKKITRLRVKLETLFPY